METGYLFLKYSILFHNLVLRIIFQMSANDPSVPIDVDLTHSVSGVWLVKVPKYLSKILDDYGDGTANGEVGRLVRRSGTAGKSNPSTGSTGRAQDVFFCLNDQILDKLREENPTKDYQLPPREHQFW